MSNASLSSRFATASAGDSVTVTLWPVSFSNCGSNILSELRSAPGVTSFRSAAHAADAVTLTSRIE